jgi:hypothetical protein
MNLTLRIPDDLAERLGADAATLERRALEALALEEYRAGRLFASDLCRLLGLSRYELDGWLKAREVYHDLTPEELNRQLETVDRLGL